MIRGIDLIITVVALVVLCPVILLLWVMGFLIMGNPIFRQTRLGRDGKSFELLKFRSLPIATNDMPTHMLDPSEIPPYGSFLRRSKLDELPQLWCVLKGDMSLVGPRPGLPSQHLLAEARKKRGVLHLTPGITGLSQIRQIDMSTPVKLARFDAIMARHWGVKLYAYILFMTLLGSGAGDRVRK